MMGKVAHLSLCAGKLLVLLAAVSRLGHWSPMGLGPRSFAAGAALLLLLSIAIHVCPGVARLEAEHKD